jgi:hypothetical protein
MCISCKKRWRHSVIIEPDEQGRAVSVIREEGMTVVEVDNDACGFRTRITVRREGGFIVRLKVASECEAVEQWGRGIARTDWRCCLGRHPLDSVLWRTAVETLNHRSCPVLTATLRAIETEIEAARPADIRIRFLPTRQ